MNAGLNTTRKKKELDKLYELQQDRKEAFQYIENFSGDIYRLSLLFMEVLKKYLPDDVEEKRQDEPAKQGEVQEASEGQYEYFNMELLSPIHETCVEEQFESITIADFYANINLYPARTN